MATSLTTLAAVRAQLSFDNTLTGDDALISTYVEQASAMIETYCKRTLAAANGTLHFDVRPPDVYGNKLFFGADVIGVYAVVNGDGETVASSDYQLLPNNSTPKYAIRLLNGKAWTYDTNREAAITIAGTLGMFAADAIPDDLALAATKLAAWLYQTRDNREDNVRFADGSMVIPSDAPAVVLRILDKGRYVKDRMFV